jgi:hypothetical protein
MSGHLLFVRDHARATWFAGALGCVLHEGHVLAASKIGGLRWGISDCNDTLANTEARRLCDGMNSN